jgi:hypothetical protein
MLHPFGFRKKRKVNEEQGRDTMAMVLVNLESGAEIHEIPPPKPMAQRESMRTLDRGNYIGPIGSLIISNIFKSISDRVFIPNPHDTMLCTSPLRIQVATFCGIGNRQVQGIRAIDVNLGKSQPESGHFDGLEEPAVRGPAPKTREQLAELRRRQQLGGGGG